MKVYDQYETAYENDEQDLFVAMKEDHALSNKRSNIYADACQLMYPREASVRSINNVTGEGVTEPGQVSNDYMLTESVGQKAAFIGRELRSASEVCPDGVSVANMVVHLQSNEEENDKRGNPQPFTISDDDKIFNPNILPNVSGNLKEKSESAKLIKFMCKPCQNRIKQDNSLIEVILALQG